MDDYASNSASSLQSCAFINSQHLAKDVHLLASEVEHSVCSRFQPWDFMWGLLTACALVALALYLAWEYLQRRLQRREEELSVTAIRNLDRNALQRVLGKANLPAWVKFPDHERVHLVNDVIEQLWPHVNIAAGVAVREALGPALQENMPRWISDIRLHTFNLGDNPPHINSVKVFKGENIGDEVVLEAEVVWAGNQQFQLLVKPLPSAMLLLGRTLGKLLANVLQLRAGVNNFYFRGTVRVSLGPLINTIPVVGAMQVSFVDYPEFDYSLTLYGGDLTFIPGLEAFINSFIRDRLLQPYILPDAFTFPVAEHVNRARMPAGVLYVKLIEAKHLPKTDWFSKPDSFVEVYVRESRRRVSKVMHNTYHPMWNEEYMMLVHYPDHQHLTAVLYDRNVLTANEEIGRVSVPIKDLPHGEVQDLWLDVDHAHAGPQSLISAGLKGVKTVGRTALNVASFAVNGFHKKHRKPPKLHLQVGYYRVGEEQIEAAKQAAGAPATPGVPALPAASAEVGDGTDRNLNPGEASTSGWDAAQPSGTYLERTARSAGSSVDADRQAALVNMLKGGVLYVIVKKQTEDQDGEEVATSARQVCVVIGGQHKCTAEAQGKDDPGWDECLDFALGAETVSDPNAQIVVEVWDYHWVNYIDTNLTWAEDLGLPKLPDKGTVHIPLHEVIQRKKLANTWQLEEVPGARIALELQWLSILESA